MKGVLHRIYHGETDIDFIGRRRLWFAISGIVLAVCVGSLATRWLNFGIEFEGGVSILAPVPDDGPLGDAADLEVIEEVRSAVEAAGATDAQVQVSTDEDGRSVIVQSKAVEEAEQQAGAIEAVSEATGAEDVDSQRTGETWGAEITRKALRALIVSLVVIFIFISLRFEWKMALATFVALVHDLLITGGVYSLVGFEVTPSTVVAILTILGYSMYDTVVVFDKVEENTSALAGAGKATYQDAANLALNQVFMRSLNTTLSTVLPVAALLIIGVGLLGAGTLKDLALALLVGLLTGAYSSVFVATPLLAMMKEREPRFRSVRERVLREARKVTPLRPAASAESEAAEVDEAVVEEEGRASTAVRAKPSTPRPATRARAGTKKAKRRKRR